MKVRGENQVGSFRDGEREAIGQCECAATECPPAKTARHARDRIGWRIVRSPAAAKQTGKTASAAAAATKPHTAAHAAAKAGAGVACVPLARCATRVEEEQTVMHDRAR